MLLNFAQIPIYYGNSYHPRFRAVLNVAASLGYAFPSVKCLSILNSLVVYLVNTGVFNELDIFYVLANDVSSLFGTINFINPYAHQITLASSPTLVNKEGYDSVGSGYLNTNYAPATQGVKYTLNSACVGGYIKTFASIPDGTSSVICGLNSSTNHIFLGKNGSNASRIGTRLNSGPSPDVTFNVSTNFENDTMYAGTRTDSSNFQAVKNGSVLATSSTSSTSIPTGNLYGLARNASGTANLILGSGNRLSCLFAGSSAASQSALNTGFQAYMSALATI